MKTFIKNICLYGFTFILLIGISFSINKFLIYNYGFLTIDNRLNKIILGASRTACAINEKYLDGSYNISSAADDLIYSKIKLRIFKNNNSNIDTVFLSLDNRKLYRSNDLNRSIILMESRIPKYCYYFTTSEWKHMIDIDFSSTIMSLSLLPKYSLKLFISTFKGSKKKSKDLRIGDYQEVKHVVKQDVIDDFIKNDSTKNYSLSKTKIDNLIEIVKFCNLNNIELIFINPPLHPVMFNSFQYQEGKIIFENYLKNTFPNHTYLDFSDNFLPDSCYADLIHLNKKGSEIFSKKLDQILKNSNSKN